jgi:carbon-monoxide dehydrogenase medium subunit
VAGLAVAPTLAAALERLEDPGARPLAGGVGIMLARARGIDGGGDFVGVGHLPELLGWRAQDDGAIEIGAAVTLEALAEAMDDDRIPALLRSAAAAAANPGIRAVATIGGNVVDTGAGSDLVAALIALGAEVRIVRREAARTTALADLWTVAHDGSDDGPGRPPAVIALRPGDLIEALIIPSPAPVGWGWERLTLHGAMDRSAASLAVAILRGGGARVALTAAVTRPIRLGAVEGVLEAATGASSSAAGVDIRSQVRQAARDDLASAPVLADDRAPAAYRREVVPVLAERAALAALARARGPADA